MERIEGVTTEIRNWPVLDCGKHWKVAEKMTLTNWIADTKQAKESRIISLVHQFWFEGQEMSFPMNAWIVMMKGQTHETKSKKV